MDASEWSSFGANSSHSSTQLRETPFSSIFTVRISNFAPGISSAEVESLIQPHVLEHIACTVTMSWPRTTVEIRLRDTSSVRKMYDVFHNRLLNGRRLIVFDETHSLVTQAFQIDAPPPTTLNASAAIFQPMLQRWSNAPQPTPIRPSSTDSSLSRSFHTACTQPVPNYETTSLDARLATLEDDHAALLFSTAATSTDTTNKAQRVAALEHASRLLTGDIIRLLDRFKGLESSWAPVVSVNSLLERITNLERSRPNDRQAPVFGFGSANVNGLSDAMTKLIANQNEVKTLKKQVIDAETKGQDTAGRLKEVEDQLRIALENVSDKSIGLVVDQDAKTPKERLEKQLQEGRNQLRDLQCKERESAARTDHFKSRMQELERKLHVYKTQLMAKERSEKIEGDNAQIANQAIESLEEELQVTLEELDTLKQQKIEWEQDTKKKDANLEEYSQVDKAALKQRHDALKKAEELENGLGTTKMQIQQPEKKAEELEKQLRAVRRELDGMKSIAEGKADAVSIESNESSIKQLELLTVALHSMCITVNRNHTTTEEDSNE